MIVFTGRGLIADSFHSLFDCEVRSFRFLSDSEAIEILRDTSVLVHNAANLEPSSLSESVESNFMLTRRLVDLSAKVNPDLRFVYLSSMSILADEIQPKDVMSMSNYSFGKYLGELYVRRSELTKAIIIRFSTLFCNDGSRDGLSRLITESVRNGEVQLINEGQAKRDFIPLAVACNYLFRFCTQPDLQGTYNVASGRSLTFREVSQWISEALGGIPITSRPAAVAMDPVSEFSLDSLAEVGIIDHDLKDYVIAYCKSLQ